jgi:uncharacterized protein YjaZ
MLWEREARVDLVSIVRRTLEKIEADLKASPVGIDVQAGSYRTIPDVGIGGVTNQITGEVQITMDQRSPVGLRRMLTVWLPLALAHELHHSNRIVDGPGYGQTLLDAIITEGSAETFVREMFPNAPAIPWVRALSPAMQATVWHRAQHDLRSPDEGLLHDSWFYGEHGLPRWAGYKIGYAIATAYLDRHPGVDAAGLALLSTDEIYRGSRYAPGTAMPRTTQSAHG